VFFGNFSVKQEEIRSKKDLVAFLRTLKKIKKWVHLTPFYRNIY